MRTKPRPPAGRAKPVKGQTRDDGRYLLRLYVTGSTASSMRAIQNLKRICEEHLPNEYDLEVIDIYQRPELAKGEHIIAAPTLVKMLPHPLKRLIGDMSDEDRVLIGLDLRPKPRIE